MIARAPGKLVLSGAYAVLDGAPAIVAAVDRYAYADASSSASWATPEVRAALGDNAPSFDASELRDGAQKLGLGSSAAILVASLMARHFASGSSLDHDKLRDIVFADALRAHRAAQGGGSGLDVAASCYGGVLEYQLAAERAIIRPRSLPPGLVIQAWNTGAPASTAELLAQVRGLSVSAPDSYRERMRAQAAASANAANALEAGSVPAWVQAICEQYEALVALGHESGAPIVTDGVVHLHRLARREGAAVLPSGAGGGDVVLFHGCDTPSSGWRAAALALGYLPVVLTLGAEGVGAVARSSLSAPVSRS